ncbi:MAG: tetratricopeptide repeat protein, partial [Bacteroidota bacterium]
MIPSRRPVPRRLTKVLVPALLVAILAGESPGQWIDDPAIDVTVRRGIDHVYNLEFYDAGIAFDSVIRARPDHPAGHFFRAMIQWWRILTNFDDRSQDTRFLSLLDQVIALCDERLKKDPDDLTALFFKGGSLGFRGRLRANRGSWVLAAKDGIAALPIVQRAYRLDPGNFDILLGIGIYNYYADVIPAQYPIVKPFMVFFPSGDRKTGFDQLRQASEHARYAHIEASYFLMQSAYLYEKDFTIAHELAARLHSRFPGNPLFHRYLGRSLVSLGKWGEAFRVFQEIERCFGERRIGYDAFDGREAYFYLGRYYFITGSW